jgi:uncharacterized protein with beta-barrel porin domain
MPFKAALFLVAGILLLPSAAVAAQGAANAAGNDPADTGVAYDLSGAVQPAQLGSLGPIRVWQTFFAGRSSLNGDGTTQHVVASVAGTSFGADSQLGEIALVGGSLGLGHQTFSSGSSYGNSEDVTLTLYASRVLFGNVYASTAVGYGWHRVLTVRPALFTTDILTARYHATDFGGRLESGYRFDISDTLALSPYTAFVGDNYNQPAYQEINSDGSTAFAASFASKSTSVTHLELGGRYGQYFKLDDTHGLSADALAAWEHELDDNPYVLASFQRADDQFFYIPGTRPARETALLGLGLRLETDKGLTIGARTDARIGAGTTIMSGTADLTFQW